MRLIFICFTFYLLSSLPIDKKEIITCNAIYIAICNCEYDMFFFFFFVFNNSSNSSNDIIISMDQECPMEI